MKETPSAPIGKKEFLIVKERYDMSTVNAYFYAIRNTLAHGSFEYKKGFYEIENWNKGELKAVGKINESTLLSWIELCGKTVKELKEYRKR